MPTWLIVVLGLLAIPFAAIVVLMVYLSFTKTNPFQ